MNTKAKKNKIENRKINTYKEITKRAILEMLFDWCSETTNQKTGKGCFNVPIEGTPITICTKAYELKADLFKINKKTDNIFDNIKIKTKEKITTDKNDLTNNYKNELLISLNYNIKNTKQFFNNNYSEQAYVKKLKMLKPNIDIIKELFKYIKKETTLTKDNEITINTERLSKKIDMSLGIKIINLLVCTEDYWVLPHYKTWSHDNNKFLTIYLPHSKFDLNNYSNFIKALTNHNKKKTKLAPVITFKNNELLDATNNIKIEDVREKDFIYSVCDFIFNNKNMGDEIYWDEIAEHATGDEQGSGDKDNKRKVYDSVKLINKKAIKKIKQEIIKNNGMDKYQRLA